MTMLLKIPCSIYRGGTSKAVFFRKEDLPSEPSERDKMMLSIFGTDPFRINGVGSPAVNMSKIVFVNSSIRDATDIEYTHGQVSLDMASIDYTMNGANIAFAVGLYALQNHMVKATLPTTHIRTFNANSQTTFDIFIPVQKESVYHPHGEVLATYPDLMADSFIELRYQAPQGEITGSLFPTGQRTDRFAVKGSEVPVTIIDSGNLSLHIDGRALGLDGTEVEECQYLHIREQLDSIRQQAVDLIRSKCPELTVKFEESGLPKLVLLGDPIAFTSNNGQPFSKEHMDIWLRDVTFNKLHQSVPASGAVTIGIASFIPGTVANRITRFADQEGTIRIGNPSGIFESKASVALTPQGWTACTASVFGTAKALMTGYSMVAADGAG
jgi:2-methylaconitate cis-trans-isomerase PrpF